LKLLNIENPSMVLINGSEIMIDGVFVKNEIKDNDENFKLLRKQIII